MLRDKELMNMWREQHANLIIIRVFQFLQLLSRSLVDVNERTDFVQHLRQFPQNSYIQGLITPMTQLCGV